ncbi:MAG: glycine cleavage system protein GcvH [Alphaproteobacteria bacterium]|nr:glycine cleavage system protein GcvH [Alphaproteobacteria bacterium]
MSDVRDDRKYSSDHEWVKVGGDVATVGITQHAQEALGDLVFVEVPEVGATVSKGDAFAVVESVKAASDVYAPVSGEVVEVNTALGDKPETINDSPYDKGWIAKIRLSNVSELDALMDASAYADLLKE